MNEKNIQVAKWWQETDHNKILCTLCPRYCKIGRGQSGFCFIRQNLNDTLYTTGYGKPIGFAIDPIEKKPLNHFYPGSDILSFGTAGCNLGCRFCQNWSMSKAKSDASNALYASPEDVVALAHEYKVPSIAYTYNDPTIFGEYVIDISKIGRQEGIKSVMVTNGYIDKEARKQVYQNIDAANIDLKAFTERFYRKLTFAHLKDVLDTLIWLKKDTDIWFEITTLLIPHQNDSQEEIKRMVDWILQHLGSDIPIHFTAFHPDFKMTDTPPTPPQTLQKARKTAIDMGIKYCYVGNIMDSASQTTYCPGCGKPLIERSWHNVSNNLIADGYCPDCHTAINGIWT
ncbi:MAG: AmmeMemoRadiSam system radical SAM enzyme [Caldithrix sp.]|nr:AmmeMemoRadiSam system radical SAM enzyme [Caldithrix sp.]